MDKLSREIIERIAKEFNLRTDDPQVLQIAYKVLWETATGHDAGQAERDPHPLLPADDDPCRRVPDKQDLTELVDSILDDPQPRTGYLARPLPLAVTSKSTGVWLKDLVKNLREALPGSAMAEERENYRTPSELPVAGPYDPTVAMTPPVLEHAPEAMALAPAPKPSREMPWAAPPLPPGARRLGPRYVPRSAAAAHSRGDGFSREGALPEQAAKSAPAWLLAGTAHFVIAIVLMNIVYFTTRGKDPGVFRVTLSTPVAVVTSPEKPIPPPVEPVKPPIDPEVGPSGDPDGKGNQDTGMDGREDEPDGPAGTEIPDRAPGNVGLPNGPGEVVADSTDVKIGVGDGATPGNGGSGTKGPGGAYSGRGGDARKQRLRKYGGGDDTEEAVARGLKWLAAHQMPSGHWGGGSDTSRCPAGDECVSVDSAMPMVTTSFALLAFAGAGYTQIDDHDAPYRATVERGVRWLLGCQQKSGQFVDPGSSTLYVHAMATMAAAELFGLSKDPMLEEPVKKAIAYIVEAQQQVGGWDYDPARTNRGDASVSGWQVMALRCARAAGIQVPEKTISRAAEYYRRATDKTKVSILYELKEYEVTREGSLLILTSGALSSAFVGVRDEGFMSRASERIGRVGPQLGDGAKFETPWIGSWYWTYTGTLFMFYRGGSSWTSWNKDMKKLVLGMQETKGHQGGSWPPVNSEVYYGGRSYSTAMACVNLEVYYRYLPSYSMPLPSVESDIGAVALPPAIATSEELVAVLKAKDMLVRRGAFKELVVRREATAVPALIEAARAETTSARPLMVEDLAAFDMDETVLEALVAFTGDEDAKTREAAARGLKKATGEAFQTSTEWASWWAARKK